MVNCIHAETISMHYCIDYWWFYFYVTLIDAQNNH